MRDEEARWLLGSRNHGVLSMGFESRGYGLPMSYKYDEASDRIVLGVADAPGSKKREFITATEEATLTVYQYEDVDSWECAIVTGTIHPLEDDPLSDGFALVFFSQRDAETGDRTWVDLDDLDREWYELRIADISGRHS